ncbi:MAG: hypothetical protein QME57_02375 [Patescibacteria group bacterium]|nr:hypothetical protein [Patescibacteria group bacterium]
MFLFSQKNQKGETAIFLAIVILSIVLAVSLGISKLMIKQLKMTTEIGETTLAFYAADSGAEKCLYQHRKGTGEGCHSEGVTISGTLGNGARYETVRSSNQIISEGWSPKDKTYRRIKIEWRRIEW